MLRKPLLTLVGSCLVLFGQVCSAEDLEQTDLRKNDFKFIQFNLIKSVDNKIPFELQDDTYLEMEFGGRSAAIDLYGFLDIFDIFDSSTSDFHSGDNFFFKFEPRFSLDVLGGRSLAIGPFKEWYIATLFYIGDRALFEQYLGIGTDVEIPWFGKVGTNLMARYVRENYGAANERRWDGYIASINWFTPFYHFENKTYVTYQGYFDHIFGAYEVADDKERTDSFIGWYNGLYWHSTRYAAGYGLKIYKDMGLFKNGGIGGNTSGAGHYFVLTYKF